MGKNLTNCPRIGNFLNLFSKVYIVKVIILDLTKFSGEKNQGVGSTTPWPNPKLNQNFLPIG